MSFELDMSEVKPDTVAKDFAGLPAGKYHAKIIEVEEYAGKNGEMTVKYESLIGRDAGGTHLDYMSTTPKAMQRIARLGVMARMFTESDLTTWSQSGRSPAIDWQGLVGRQVLIELHAEEYQGKTRNKLGFGIWDIDDPDHADIPKNEQQAARFRQLSAGNAQPSTDPVF